MKKRMGLLNVSILANLGVRSVQIATLWLEKKCAGCMDAPEYRPDKVAFVMCYSRDC